MVVLGALEGLRGDYWESAEPRPGAVALLEQLVRVTGRAPTRYTCAASAASTGDVAVLDWLWDRADPDRARVTDMDVMLTSICNTSVLRWVGRHNGLHRLARPRTQWPSDVYLRRQLLCGACDRCDVEFVRAFVEETRCLGRQVAWVFDYALAHEEQGGASTLPILRLLADRFRMKHLRVEARGRIDRADRAGEHRRETVEWLVERFGLDRLPAPTKWRDRWEHLRNRDLRYFTATYRAAVARQAL
jgi:hypothetical protein